MKENAIHRVTPRKVKGTVLFTVVCVMMVLTVFLLGTLALAATANNRAVKNFSSVQTQQTAKAGVEAIMAAMRNNKDIAKSVNDITATTPITNIDVGFEDPSLGKIESATIEYAGVKYIIDTHEGSTTKNQMVAKKVVRISATAVQGKARTTVSAYVLSDPDAGNSNVNTVTPSANGFVSTGTASTANHVSAFGGTAFGFDDIYGYEYEGGTRKLDVNNNPIPLTSYRQSDMTFCLNNGQTVETDARINGSLSICAENIDFLLRGTGSGITVWGSMYGKNNLTLKTVNSVIGTAENQIKSGVSYKDIPYLYVDHALDYSSSGCNIVTLNDSVFNIYCGEFLLGKAPTGGLKCNVYAFNECDGTTYTDKLEYDNSVHDITYTKGLSKITADNFSMLYGWTNSVLSADGTSKSVVSGNFYSNGNLELASNGAMTFGTAGKGNEVKVQGDLIVTIGNHTINGDLYVGNKITVNGGSLTVTGKVYYDGDLPAGITANGGKENLSNYSESEVERRLKAGYTQDTTAKKAKYAKDLNTGSGNFKAWMKQEWDGTREKIPQNLVQVIDESAGQLNLKYEGANLVYEGGTENGQPYPDALIPSYINYYNGATIVSMDEATELWYKNDASIDASKRGKKVETPVIFPREYTREVLTGMEAYDSTTPLDKTKVVTFPYELLTDANKTPYATYTEVKNSNRKDDHGNAISDEALCRDNVFTLTSTGVSVDKGDAAGKISYDAGSSTYTIADSCTIKGGLSNQTLKITPPKSTTLWIVIDGDKFEMTGNSKIILDDVSKEDCSVNILLKTHLDIYSGGNVITTAAYDDLLYGSTHPDFQIYTDTKYKMASVSKVAPNVGINIFSSETGAQIWTQNKTLIIANINAPYCDFDAPNGGLCADLNQNGAAAVYPKNAHIYYNGYDVLSGHVQHKALGVIGQCITHKFSAGNDWTLLYIPVTGGTVPPPGEDNFEDALMTSWAVLYWENY